MGRATDGTGGAARVGRAAGPVVSVVIPTHHRPALLAKTVASVLAQTVRDLEVIVVIDGADPAARAVLLERSDERIRPVVHHEAQGVSAARNAGLARACGRWVAFCDDDDLWAPSKLERQLGELCAPAEWCVTSEVRLFDGGRLGPIVHPPDGRSLPAALRRANVVPAGGSGVVADRLLVQRLGGFDERLAMFADWDLWLRLAAAAPAVSVREPLVAYRDHAGGMSRDMSRVNRELALLQGKHGALAEPIDVERVKHWCFERVLTLPDRRERVRALRALLRDERPSAVWTATALARVMAPRPLVRGVRDLQHRWDARGDRLGWVPLLEGASLAGPTTL